MSVALAILGLFWGALFFLHGLSTRTVPGPCVVWSHMTCAIPDPCPSWHERRAHAHACPYSHRAAPNPHTKIAVAKRNPAISIYIYVYIYWGVYACITNGKHACTSADFFRIYNQTPANLGPSNASNASNELEYCPFPL